MDRINDLAFVVDGKVVVLVEHQSTINMNMPLRCLLYISRVYERIFDNDLIYESNLVKVPVPEFYVLYNGDSALAERSELKLSDAFKTVPELCEDFSLELTAKVFNVNKGYNTEIVRQSETLDGYVYFVDKVKRFIAEGCDITDALTRAINECIEEGILVDYLKENGSEVQNMLFQEWNLNKALDVRYREGEISGIMKGKAEGIAKGKAEGIAEGIAEGNAETARRMLLDGFRVEDVAKYTMLSPENIISLKPLPPNTVS
jgi:hypothetical protein